MKPKSQLLKWIDDIEGSLGSSSGEAVVVEAADVSRFIKSYTEVESTDEYKVVYCGAENQIIVQGMVLFKYQTAAPNGVIIKAQRSSNLSKLPNIPYYVDVDFSPASVYKSSILTENADVEIRGAKYKVESSSGGTTNYGILFNMFKKGTGERFVYTLPCNTSETGFIGFSFAYSEIFPPGTEYSGTDGAYKSKFGYVKARLIMLTKSDGVYSLQTGYDFPIPFASIDEYNAAVALTAVPQTMAAAESVEL